MSEYDDDDDDLDEVVDSVLLKEIMVVDEVKNHDWSMKKAGNIKVTLDGARSHAWIKAQAEIDFVRGKLYSLIGKGSGTRIPDLIHL